MTNALSPAGQGAPIMPHEDDVAPAAARAMTEPPPVHADLAFLRTLVEGDGRLLRTFGLVYMYAGLAYGAQVLVQWADFAGVVALPGPVMLAAVTLPTAGLVALSLYFGWRARGTGVSPPNRALNAVFNGTGLANVVVIAMLVMIAANLKMFAFILVYPAVIFTFQGAAWFVAFRIFRRAWMLAVALGWFATSLAMAAAISTQNLHVYIGVAAAALFLLMALPGAIVMREGRKETQA
jgi:hypothetical protein